MAMQKWMAGALVAAAFAATGAHAQACSNRGDLDERFCDEDKNLIADLPKDAKQWQNPATLIFSYTPVEDPAVYENVFDDFMTHLAKVTGKKVRWFPAESYAALSASPCLHVWSYLKICPLGRFFERVM